MRLCKYDTPRVLCQEGVHDDVRDEGDIACGVALLLVPAEAEGVAFERGCDIVEAVPIHVVDTDLRATRAAGAGTPAAEGLRMPFPEPFLAGWRLLPPAVGTDVILAAIAVDVTDAEAMSDVDAPRSRLRDGFRNPFAGRIGGIGFGIAEAVVTGVNDLGLAVAVDVLQQRLFVANGSRTT